MIECNIYSGRKGRIDYQETSNHYWRQNSMHRKFLRWMLMNMAIHLKNVNG